jgi:hypothetical protein
MTAMFLNPVLATFEVDVVANEEFAYVELTDKS